MTDCTFLFGKQYTIAYQKIQPDIAWTFFDKNRMKRPTDVNGGGLTLPEYVLHIRICLDGGYPLYFIFLFAWK